MECLDSGALRAYLDEEMGPEEKAAVVLHLAECVGCREELARLSARAEATHALLAALAPDAAETVPVAVALRTSRHRRAERRGLWQRLQGGFVAMNEGSWLRGWRAAGAALMMFVLVGLMVMTPLGVALGDSLSLFRVEKFAPVTIDPAKVSSTSAPKLDPAQMGAFTVKVDPQHKEYPDVAAAKGAVTFGVRTIGKLPAGISGAPKVYANSAGDVTYTFDLAKTKAALAEQGINVQLPAGFDGATVRVYVPAAVQLLYASDSVLQSLKATPSKTGEQSGTPNIPSGSAIFLYQGGAPTLEIPAVLDTPDMRNLFFQLSGLPPELIDQLQAMSQQKTTVPVPVLKGDTSQQVTVDGTQAVLVNHKPAVAGNSAPEGSYIVWQKNGIVYALGGNVSAADLQAAANSLQ